MNKHYLLCVSEPVMDVLKQLLPGVSYVPVVGMDINDQPAFKLLASPVDVPTVAEPCLPVSCADEPTECDAEKDGSTGLS